MLKRFGILLASLLWAAYAYSQAFDMGQVSGSARDASGSVIPGVSVTIRNEAQGQERQTLTNEPGSPGAPAVNPVNNNPTQGSFGLVTAKDGNRTMQVSLQYVF